jgi:hypothetical protein
MHFLHSGATWNGFTLADCSRIENVWKVDYIPVKTNFIFAIEGSLDSACLWSPDSQNAECSVCSKLHRWPSYIRYEHV